MTDRQQSHAAADLLRLWVKAVQCRRVKQQIVHVDYEQAQADCEQLAAQLAAAYGRDGLRDFAFTAIPRGGLIVLGMLAYALDLAAGQLAPRPPDAGRPLCIVDDCALTGLRFAEFLAAVNNERVVFAHLYSHPALRRGIQAAEPRVQACIAAHDLASLAPDRDATPAAGADHPAGWPEMPVAGRYWSGSAAPVIFAWSEPAIHVRDPFTGEIERGWRFGPPHRCLRNRVELAAGPRPAAGPAAAAGRCWQAPAAVVWRWDEGRLWLLQTATEASYLFEGLRADMWRSLAAHGDVAAALAWLRERHPQAGESLSVELDAFIAYARAEWILEAA